MVRKYGVPFPSGYGVRLHLTGCASRPYYLIGAMPRKVAAGKKPDQRPEEIIGSIDPMPNERGELLMACDLTRLSYYFGKGAHPSSLLTHFLGLVGFYPMAPKLFINAWRTREGKPSRRGLRPNVYPDSRNSDSAAASQSTS